MTTNMGGDKQVRVEMRHICKRFEDVIALDDANLMLQVGEVHALLGENGAGKTTLMNTLSGLYRADSGEIFINGHQVEIHEPGDAIKLRIAMVHQHFELIDNFNALDNIILGQEGGGLTINVMEQERKVTELSVKYGLKVSLRTKVKDLPISTRQKVEILKALYRGADILILDEPTTMLTPQEVDGLFNTIESLMVTGLTVVLITHKIHEVLKISDRITVMRRGKVVKTLFTKDANEEKLVSLMMGAEFSVGLAGLSLETACPPSDLTPILRVQNLKVKDSHHFTVVQDVSFDICGGQIVGLVGVTGNGQRELVETIFGLRHASGGKIILEDKEITHLCIKDRIAKGIVYIPEDRINQGILPHLTLAETMVLGAHHFLYKGDRIFQLSKACRKAAAGITEFDIRAPSEFIATSKLSGGNIQKVLLARAFMLDDLVGIKLLIAFNPTHGLDIMTTHFVHSKLAGLRTAGKSTLLISEDLDEALELCDRIIIMRGGKLAGSAEKPNFDRYQIGLAMVGKEVVA